MPAPTNALVLAAGLGVRLRPLTLVRAKPALPVGDEPLIGRILRGLRAANVRDVVVNLHHLPSTLTSVIGDGSQFGVRVRYSWEQPVLLGNAGGPRQARDIIGAKTFFVLNGDTLSDVNLAALAADHERSGALVTLALTPNRATEHYGGVEISATSEVIGFARKGEAARHAMHFVGVQIASAEAFDDVPVGRATSSVGEAYDRLIERRPGSIRGFVTEAAFWDIGTVGDYVEAVRSLGGPESKWMGRSVAIDGSARVTRSILWDDIDVGAHATVDGCIVTDGVRIPAGAAYQKAILRVDAAQGLVASPLEGPA